ncbi:uncharacterized protein [Phyllobates terribilis]|uniref:uncharacterized protein n=1 Tax=Phyllobates terribilis TaxID=111132 RepID=UPI003CCAE399
MPSVTVKLYSVLFKLRLKHSLHNRIQSLSDENSNCKPDSFGISTRPEETVASANPVFTDGVATKDIHIDAFSSLTVRIFLPDSALSSNHISPNSNAGCDSGAYRGYLPSIEKKRNQFRKLPVIVQFHGGGFVSGSNDSVANDFFCRRIAKLCDAIVVAVGYRLAPESRYPAAFEDGWKVLNWLAKQANLAECSKSLVVKARGGGEGKKVDPRRQIVKETFGASMVEPWLAAHGDPSRCALLGVSCGSNIADYIARKSIEESRHLSPLKVVAQILLYPFFMGTIPTQSETTLSNSYFYDKPTSLLAWKLLLPDHDFSLDHRAANPLLPGAGPPLKLMPPTLTVVAEHDWMRDRAIHYSEALRRENVDAPVLEYKDSVHEFATLDILLKTPQAQACAEDVAIWVKKYISVRGHEFSY